MTHSTTSSTVKTINDFFLLWVRQCVCPTVCMRVKTHQVNIWTLLNWTCMTKLQFFSNKRTVNYWISKKIVNIWTMSELIWNSKSETVSVTVLLLVSGTEQLCMCLPMPDCVFWHPNWISTTETQHYNSFRKVHGNRFSQFLFVLFVALSNATLPKLMCTLFWPVQIKSIHILTSCVLTCFLN